jgi:ABC-type multidrug transport system ATPase subunit
MNNLFLLKNVLYSANDSIILDKINAFIPKNKLTCILGKSGAGKTSLMSILSGQILQGNIEGKIKFCNNNFNKELMKNSIAYVKQKDILSENLTIYELILLCATLKLKVTKDEIKIKVNNIIDILDLTDCKDTFIGGETKKGISGGQKKRISIALELINDPDIIFLDEPTSGLDTYNAFNVMQILKKLVDQGKTIITILHQPASEIFHLIDHLIVIDKGKICYCDKQPQFINFINNIGYQCPIYTNPADFLFMNILNSDYDSLPYNKNRYNRGFLFTFRVLIKRRMKEIYRNRRSFKVKIFQSLFLSLVIALVYMNTDMSQQSIQNRIGLLFFISMQVFMSATYSNIHIFYDEKSIFFREYASKWYSLSSYFLTRSLAEIPVNLLTSLLLGSIVYFAVGLKNTFVNYLIFVIVISFCTLCGNGFGVLIGTMFSRIEIGLAVSPTILVPILLFSGLFQNTNTVPSYFSWIKYISPVQYSFNSLAQNEFRGLDFNCNSTDKECLYETGEDVLNYLNFGNNMTISINILIMFIIYLFLLLMAYLFLRKSVHKKSHDPYKEINKEIESVTYVRVTSI